MTKALYNFNYASKLIQKWNSLIKKYHDIYHAYNIFANPNTHNILEQLNIIPFMVVSKYM